MRIPKTTLWSVLLLLSITPVAARAQGGRLDWSTLLGTAGADGCAAAVVLPDGSVVVAGRTTGSGLPVSAGAFDATHNGGQDVFVARVDAAGRRVLRATYLGGSGDDVPRALAVTPAGDVVVVGWTRSADFPVTAGAFDTSLDGGAADGDAFVARFDPALSRLDFATFLGGATRDEANGVALTEGGEVLVCGHTNSADFPTTLGAFQRLHQGGFDGFACRLRADGATLAFATYLGAAADDFAHTLVMGDDESLWLGGETESPGFPTVVGAFDRTHHGLRDGFVVRVAPDGGSLLAGAFCGGAGEDRVYALAWRDGVLFVAGETSSADFPVTAGAFDVALDGASAGFALSTDARASTRYFATFVDGEAWDRVLAIAPGGGGELNLAGETGSVGFPTTAGAFDATFHGGGDGFVARLSADGRRLTYGSFLGGEGADSVAALAPDGPAGVVVVGATGSWSFPTTPGAFRRALQPDDGYVLRVDLGLPSIEPTPFGAGTPGFGGRCPLVAANSDVHPAHPGFGVLLTDARAASPAFALLALARAVPAVDLGWTLLVDPVTFLAALPAQTDARGDAFVPAPIPGLDAANLGGRLVFQGIVYDAAAAAGWSASRGLELTILATPRPGSPIPGSYGLHFESLAAKNAAATQALLSRWRTRGGFVPFDEPNVPYLHVVVPAAGAHEFVADARTVPGVVVAGDFHLEVAGQGEAGWPDDPRWAQQWGIEAAGGPIYLGPMVPRVAVVDSGVFTAHEDLTGRVAAGYDAVDDDQDPTPRAKTPKDLQHGTKMAGLLTAGVDNRLGITGMLALRPGVAATPFVSAYRVFGASNHAGWPGGGFDALWSALTRIHERAEADIVNFSGTTHQQPGNALRKKRADLLAALETTGIMLSCSTGNLDADNANPTVGWPANGVTSIGVGAADSQQRFAPFSCRGPELDLLAPGAGVLSTTFDATAQPPSGYALGDGTSEATPHVTAALAAIWSFTRAAQPGRPAFVRELLYEHAVARLPGEPAAGRGMLDLSGELLLSKENGLVGAVGLRFPRRNTTLLDAGRDLWGAELSPDRAFVVFSDGHDIYLQERARAGRAAGPRLNLTRLDPMPGHRDSPVFTPDGERVLFWVSDDRSSHALRWVRRDGVTFGMVAPLPEPPDHLHVSPDGAFVTFGEITGGLVSIDLATGARRVEAPRASVGGRLTTYGHPRWSPDGTTIAAYMVEIDPNGGGCFPTFVRYGTALVTVRAGGGHAPVLVAGVAPTSLCGQPGGAWVGEATWCPTWSPNGRHLYYLRNSNVPGMNAVRAVDLRTGVDSFIAAAPDASGQPLWGRQRLISSRW